MENKIEINEEKKESGKCPAIGRNIDESLRICKAWCFCHGNYTNYNSPSCIALKGKINCDKSC